MRLSAAPVLGLLGFFRRTERTLATRRRGPVTHVVLLDGTMSSLEPGRETNIGLIYKLLEEVAPTRQVGLLYDSGLQWQDWSSTMSVIEGRGINRQIRRAYGYLASRYRPGDRICLLGYSRGAYAVRSLAGMIQKVGLLYRDEATVRMIRNAWRLYEYDAAPDVVKPFRDRFCQIDCPIEMIGVFDTVKALGIRAPFVWRWSQVRHAHHDDRLGPDVRHAYHALALNETREAFAPVLWTTERDRPGVVEQAWFRGTHGDIGGQLGGVEAARPLANVPLVWMLERMERCDVPLPDDWRARLPSDPAAPSVGNWQGWAKLFLIRRPRVVGVDPSETIHETARGIGLVAAGRTVRA